MSRHNPSDNAAAEATAERVRTSFARQEIMSTFGARLETIDPAGKVSIAMPYSAQLTQQNGFIHAGATATILDSACGYAALTLMPPGAEVLTIEFKANYLRPAAGTRFVATGTVIQPGRTIMVAEGRAVAFGGKGDTGAGVLIATMTATLIVMEGT
ncbi:MAG: PaaI family thioesterase [Pseudomonadota bacterium]